MLHAKAYLFTLIPFLAIDLLWLGVVARRFYVAQMGGLMRDRPDYAVAGGFYLAYVAGIVFFAVAPALAEGWWGRAAINGAVLGLLAYGTYDLTNLATVRDWPLAMSIVDIAWGGLLTAASALLGFLLTRMLS